MAECQAWGCLNNKRKDKDLSYFRVPDPTKNQQRALAERWLHNIGTGWTVDTFTFSKNKVVCENHFLQSDFEVDKAALLLGYTPRCKRLKESAFPSVFVHRKPPPDNGRGLRLEKRLMRKTQNEVKEKIAKLCTSTTEQGHQDGISVFNTGTGQPIGNVTNDNLMDQILDLVNVEDDEEDPATVYEQALRTLDAHFDPDINIPFERHVFRKMAQEPGETVDEFVARLKRQAVFCAFEDKTDENIREQVIEKCRNLVIRRKLLAKGNDLSLASLQQLARSVEMVDLQLKNDAGADNSNYKVEEFSQENQSVNQVNQGSRRYQRGGVKYKSRSQTVKDKTGNDSKNFSCYRCGKLGHGFQDSNCPVKNSTCDKCGKFGHYAVVYRTKDSSKKKNWKPKSRINQVEIKTEENSQFSKDSDSDFAFTVQFHNDDESMIEINIGGINLDMLIDSGATCNIIDEKTWEDMKKKKIKCTSQKVEKKIYSYGSNVPLKTLGKFQTLVKFGDKCVLGEFVVIKGVGRALLGKKTAEELNVLRLGPEVNRITNDNILTKYSDCFGSLGKLKDYQAEIHIDPSVKPIAQKPRREPFGLRSKIKEKIEELIKLDILEEVKGPTPWVSPLVVVPKANSDEIRLCVDMRLANNAIIRQKFPIPTVDEVLRDRLIY